MAACHCSKTHLHPTKELINEVEDLFICRSIGSGSPWPLTRLCGLVVKAPAFKAGGPGSIPGRDIFSTLPKISKREDSSGEL